MQLIFATFAIFEISVSQGLALLKNCFANHVSQVLQIRVTHWQGFANTSFVVLHLFRKVSQIQVSQFYVCFARFCKVSQIQDSNCFQVGNRFFRFARFGKFCKVFAMGGLLMQDKLG